MDTQRLQTRGKGTLPAGNDGYHFLNETIKEYKVLPPYPVSSQNAAELLAIYHRVTGKNFPATNRFNKAHLLDLYEKVKTYIARHRNEYLDLMYDNDERRYVMTAYNIIGESATWMPMGPLLNMQQSKDATTKNNAAALRSMARLMCHDMGFNSILDTSGIAQYHLQIANESNDLDCEDGQPMDRIGSYMMLDEYLGYTEASHEKPKGNLVTEALAQLADYNEAKDRKTALSYIPTGPGDIMGELIKEGISWLDKGFDISQTLYNSIDLTQYEDPTPEEDEEFFMEPMERFIQECSENGQEVVTPEDSVGFTAWFNDIEDLLKESFEDAYSSHAYISELYEYDLASDGDEMPTTEKGRFVRWTMRFADAWIHITKKYNHPQ